MRLNISNFHDFTGQCQRDTFTARPSVGIKVPTICGINTGEHSE